MQANRQDVAGQAPSAQGSSHAESVFRENVLALRFIIFKEAFHDVIEISSFDG